MAAPQEEYVVALALALIAAVDAPLPPSQGNFRALLSAFSEAYNAPDAPDLPQDLMNALGSSLLRVVVPPPHPSLANPALASASGADGALYFASSWGSFFRPCVFERFDVWVEEAYPGGSVAHQRLMRIPIDAPTLHAAHAIMLRLPDTNGHWVRSVATRTLGPDGLWAPTNGSHPSDEAPTQAPTQAAQEPQPPFATTSSSAQPTSSTVTGHAAASTTLETPVAAVTKREASEESSAATSSRGNKSVPSSLHKESLAEGIGDANEGSGGELALHDGKTRSPTSSNKKVKR